jgi:ketosteroid isomerase-like protein
MSQDFVEKIRRGFDAFNRRDFDRSLAALSDDVIWEQPFVARAETSLPLRGKEQVRSAWESQVEAIDLRIEPVEFIPVGDDKVVVQLRLVAHGRSSKLSLTHSVTLVYTSNSDGLAAGVKVFESREDALKAAEAPQ